MENNITGLFGRRLSLRATRLATAFIRTSYTISRGSITLHEFPLVKARKPLFLLVKTACIFKWLKPLETRCFHSISGLFRLYLVKIVLVKTQPYLGREAAKRETKSREVPCHIKIGRSTVLKVYNCSGKQA